MPSFLFLCRIKGWGLRRLLGHVPRPTNLSKLQTLFAYTPKISGITRNCASGCQTATETDFGKLWHPDPIQKSFVFPWPRGRPPLSQWTARHQHDSAKGKTSLYWNSLLPLFVCTVRVLTFLNLFLYLAVVLCWWFDVSFHSSRWVIPFLT